MNLEANEIGPGGARHLAYALRMNQVRGLFFILRDHLTM